MSDVKPTEGVKGPSVIDGLKELRGCKGITSSLSGSASDSTVSASISTVSCSKTVSSRVVTLSPPFTSAACGTRGSSAIGSGFMVSG